MRPLRRGDGAGRRTGAGDGHRPPYRRPRGPAGAARHQGLPERRGPEGVQSELPIENQWFGELCKTADRTEGVTAFRTRRKAEFRGE